MLLSIIIPVYNGEKYIKRLFQQFELLDEIMKNIEIIVVNDGSSDNSLSMIQIYQKQYKNMLIIDQDNQGGSKARNVGLEKATGKYIYFFDVDDLFNINIFIKMFSVLKDSDYDLYMGNYDILNDRGEKIGSYKEIKNFSGNVSFENLIEFHPLPGNKIFKRELIEKYNLMFDDLKIAQDTNFYWKYCSVVKSVYMSEESWFEYYIYNNSISRTYTSKIIDIINMYEKVCEFYTKTGFIVDNKEKLEYMYQRHLVKQLLKIGKLNIEDRKNVLDSFKKEVKKYNWKGNKYLESYRKLYLFTFKYLGNTKIFIFISRLGCKLIR